MLGRRHLKNRQPTRDNPFSPPYNINTPPQSKTTAHPRRQPTLQQKKTNIDEKTAKITAYFPVRKSTRRTGKQLEEDRHLQLRQAIDSGCNEKMLDVYHCPLKGRGIRTLVDFKRNEFVVEYKGETIGYSEAKERESRYSDDPSIGSYMYFFEYSGKKWCIDATAETKYKGRLINHSARRPNLWTKLIDMDGRPSLILLAKRDIEKGEELLYDYGDRDPSNIKHSPWLINS
ncbi:unnamed protein product, partial [Mesorhabditis spiculigera]